MKRRDLLKRMAVVVGLLACAPLAQAGYELKFPVKGIKKTAEISAPIIASDGGVDWLGVVPASELISGDELATLVGLTAGNAFNSDAGWLHVRLDGQEMYIAKKSFRYNLVWDSLNEKDLVDGSRTVNIKGKPYRIRLMKGSGSGLAVNETGYDTQATHGSEWNRIMYRLHSGQYYRYTSNSTASEGVYKRLASFTSAELNIAYSGLGHENYGGVVWCMEVNGTNAVNRGRYDISHYRTYSTSNNHALYGWRPVLEPAY